MVHETVSFSNQLEGLAFRDPKEVWRQESERLTELIGRHVDVPPLPQWVTKEILCSLENLGLTVTFIPGLQVIRDNIILHTLAMLNAGDFLGYRWFVGNQGLPDYYWNKVGSILPIPDQPGNWYAVQTSTLPTQVKRFTGEFSLASAEARRNRVKTRSILISEQMELPAQLLEIHQLLLFSKHPSCEAIPLVELSATPYKQPGNQQELIAVFKPNEGIKIGHLEAKKFTGAVTRSAFLLQDTELTGTDLQHPLTIDLEPEEPVRLHVTYQDIEEGLLRVTPEDL